MGVISNDPEIQLKSTYLQFLKCITWCFISLPSPSYFISGIRWNIASGRGYKYFDKPDKALFEVDLFDKKL